jgi:hypothetical protein
MQRSQEHVFLAIEDAYEMRQACGTSRKRTQELSQVSWQRRVYAKLLLGQRSVSNALHGPAD